MSVLVPAYNTAATIGEALESALTQVPEPFEVVVSDDGSTDDLRLALRPFEGKVRIVSGPNAGLAIARNRAAAIATGDWLALLDADDVWLPGRLAALGRAASERPDLAILTTDAYVIAGEGQQRQRYYATRHFEVEDQEMAILTSQFIFGAGAIRADSFRSVGGYHLGTRYAEDWDLWLRLLLTGRRAGLVDQPLYEYRRRADSLTGHKLELAIGVLTVLARARPFVSTDLQRRRLSRTEQQWRETAARVSDPRARRLAVRAAVGSTATPATRMRLSGAAILPAWVLKRWSATS
jgi:glycosyltransferase involved in cell wall biosynthesis